MMKKIKELINFKNICHNYNSLWEKMQRNLTINKLLKHLLCWSSFIIKAKNHKNSLISYGTYTIRPLVNQLKRPRRK